MYTKESNEFVIETNPDLSTIAEIIMTSEEPMSQIKDYFNTKAVGSVADSEAPSKEATGGKSVSYTHLVVYKRQGCNCTFSIKLFK